MESLLAEEKKQNPFVLPGVSFFQQTRKCCAITLNKLMSHCVIGDDLFEAARGATARASTDEISIDQRRQVFS